MLDLSQIEGFQWDDGNSRKSVEEHAVSQTEAEQIFFNDPLLIIEDVRHSSYEARLHAPGRTDAGRLLHVSFTLRGGGKLIRIISARASTLRRDCAMNKKLKSIPKLRSEAEERQFWETHDLSEYIDWSKAERVRFPNLKPSTTAISLRPAGGAS